MTRIFCLILMTLPFLTGCYDSFSTSEPLIKSKDAVADLNIAGAYTMSVSSNGFRALDSDEAPIQIKKNTDSFIITFKDDKKSVDFKLLFAALDKSGYYIMQLSCEGGEQCEETDSKHFNLITRLSEKTIHIYFFIPSEALKEEMPEPDENSSQQYKTYYKLVKKHKLSVLYLKPEYYLLDSSLAQLKAFMNDALKEPDFCEELVRLVRIQ